MSKRFFSRLMEDAGRTNPDPEILWATLFQATSHLPVIPKDLEFLEVGFRVAFDGYLHVDPRESGEAYIYHPFRAAMREIWTMRKYSVYDTQLPVVILVHDCVEDAEKAGIEKHAQLRFQKTHLGDEVSYAAMWITKAEGETNANHNKKLLTCDSWRALGARIRDRFDNIDTIEGVKDKNRRKEKIRDTLEWYPRIIERYQFLIDREIETGRLTRKWKRIPGVLGRSLFRLVAAKKTELGIN